MDAHTLLAAAIQHKGNSGMIIALINGAEVETGPMFTH